MLSLYLHLKQEVAELCQHATESEKELNEATAKLSIAQDKVDGLEDLCVKPSRKAVQILPWGADSTI